MSRVNPVYGGKKQGGRVEAQRSSGNPASRHKPRATRRADPKRQPQAGPEGKSPEPPLPPLLHCGQLRYRTCRSSTEKFAPFSSTIVTIPCDFRRTRRQTQCRDSCLQCPRNPRCGPTMPSCARAERTCRPGHRTEGQAQYHPCLCSLKVSSSVRSSLFLVSSRDL